MKKIFYTVVMFIVSLPSLAEVYKWIDETGKTHYTQTPPPVKKEINSIQKMDKTGAVMLIKPVKIGSNFYCGNLFVLSDQAGDDVLYENIKTAIESWEEERQVQQKYVEKLKGPGTSWDAKKIKDEEDKLGRYNCRVVWGNEKLGEFESFSYRVNRTNTRLEKQYKDLKRRQEEECPADSSRFGSVLVGEAARKWHRCYSGYNKEIKEIKKKISENKKSVGGHSK